MQRYTHGSPQAILPMVCNCLAAYTANVQLAQRAGDAIESSREDDNLQCVNVVFI